MKGEAQGPCEEYSREGGRVGGAWAPQAEADGQGLRLAYLKALLAGMSRPGSDAVAVAPARSATGGALVASDPHLGPFLPPFRMIVGMRSPSYHVVGLMPPGLPIIGLGRNDDIAWAGTNMRAVASGRCDIEGTAEAAAATTPRERICTLFWFDEEVAVRRAPLGPIVSDAALIPHLPSEQIVLRWTGYEPSDEITALLAVMRAHCAEQIRRALAGFGVAGPTKCFVRPEPATSAARWQCTCPSAAGRRATWFTPLAIRPASATAN